MAENQGKLVHVLNTRKKPSVDKDVPPSDGVCVRFIGVHYSDVPFLGDENLVRGNKLRDQGLEVFFLFGVITTDIGLFLHANLIREKIANVFLDPFGYEDELPTVNERVRFVALPEDEPGAETGEKERACSKAKDKTERAALNNRLRGFVHAKISERFEERDVSGEFGGNLFWP